MQYKVVIIWVGSSTLTYNSVSQSYRPNFFFCISVYFIYHTHYTLDYVSCGGIFIFVYVPAFANKLFKYNFNIECTHFDKNHELL